MNQKKNTPGIIVFIALIILVITIVVGGIWWLSKVYFARSKDSTENISYSSNIEKEHIQYYEDACLQYADNELLIQPSKPISEKEAKALAEKHGAELVGYLSVSGTSQWRFAKSKKLEELEALSESLMDDDSIDYCMINIINQTSYAQQKCPTKEDPSWDGWNYFDKSLAYRQANADKIYGLLDKLTNPVDIGIIDSEFFDHPDLEYMHKDAVALKEGDNGYTHGSAVASVVAAKSDNGKGIAGVYPVTDERIKQGYIGNIYCCAAFDNNKVNRITGTKNLMAEMNLLADLLLKKCRVINMSYGLDPGLLYAIHLEHLKDPDTIGPYEKYHLFYPSKLKESFLNRVIDADYDVLLVEAAGNASYHTWEKTSGTFPDPLYKQINDYNLDGFNIPADWESSFSYIKNPEISKRIIVVGACNYGIPTIITELSSFSQHSERVDIVAPGERVGVISSESVTYDNGTSFSAPFVTGTIACIWSLNPNFTPEEVRSFLLKGGNERKVSDNRPQGKKDNVPPVPVLNVYASMKLALHKMGDAVPTAEESKEQKKPVYISVFGEDSNGENVPLKDARVTILTEDGSVYSDGNEKYKDIPTGVIDGEQEGEYGDASALYVFLPEGRYSVVVTADEYSDIKVDGLNPANNTKDSNNINPQFVEWSFLHKSIPKKKDANRILEDYLNSIAETHSIMDTNRILSVKENPEEEYSMHIPGWNASDLTGLLSGYIQDFDQDGQSELLTIGFESYGDATEEFSMSAEEKLKNKNDPYTSDYSEYDTSMILEMYEADLLNKKAVLQDKKIVPGLGALMTTNLLSIQVDCFAFKDKENIYIGVDKFEREEGGTFSTALYQYIDGRINYVKEVSYSQHGGSGLNLYKAEKEPPMPLCLEWIDSPERVPVAIISRDEWNKDKGIDLINKYKGELQSKGLRIHPIIYEPFIGLPEKNISNQTDINSFYEAKEFLPICLIQNRRINDYLEFELERDDTTGLLDQFRNK